MSVIKPFRFWHWFALGFGSGLAPKAPGTFGTIAALPIVAIAAYTLPPVVYATLGVVLFALGIYASDITSRDFRAVDPGYIVIDEWAGLWFSLIALPFSWPLLLLAFVLFRAFDILKPWPVSWADKKLTGGLGVMADDVIAGGLTCVCLHGLLWWWR